MATLGAISNIVLLFETCTNVRDLHHKTFYMGVVNIFAGNGQLKNKQGGASRKKNQVAGWLAGPGEGFAAIHNTHPSY